MTKKKKNIVLLNIFSRWCWSSVMIILFLGGVYLSLQLWLKFYSYPILNTISNDLPITDVAFPGVTICSPKVVNMERVKRYIKTLYVDFQFFPSKLCNFFHFVFRRNIPSKYKIEDVINGFEYLNAFTDQSWSPPNNTNITYEATDAVLHYNNVSIYEAAQHVCATCEDFVKRCFWGGYEFPCRQEHEYLSFIPTTSYLGPCCSFNYNPRNLSYVPFSSNIYGINGGLIFIGVEGSERNLSTGLIVLVHHPMDFVTESAASVTITSNSESFVEISPTVQSSSKDVLELSERKRDCLISDDLALSSYRQASCMLACQSELIMKKCQCQPYHLPNGKAQHECKLNDSLCYSNEYGEYTNIPFYFIQNDFILKNFQDTFKSAKCDQCLPNCYDVTYSTLAYKTDLLLHNYSISSL